MVILQLQYVINGLTIGAIYALIALGYTMVYGIMKFINFAHGEIMMVGTYIGLAVYNALLPSAGGDPALQLLYCLLSLVSAMGSCLVLGCLTEFFAYRPLRNSPRLAPLLSAIGVSIMLQNSAALIWGTRNRNFPMPYENITLELYKGPGGELTISLHDIMILIVALLLTGCTYIGVQKTRWGKSLRAVSMDRVAALLMGIPVDRTIASAFAVGSVLAGVAGVMASMSFTIYPGIGSMLGLKAFVAAVLGGIGSLPGAILGGILLGVLESLGRAFLGGYQDIFAFGILLAVLLIRPSGLLGKDLREKV